MKKVIVTGANGFIGSALVKELLSNNIEVVALDVCFDRYDALKSELLTTICFDMAKSGEYTEELKEYGADVFFHLAWAGSAGDARADVDLQLSNAKWTVDCLKLANEVGCTRFVCAGSIMEQETIDATCKQENKPGLGYIYGSGKLVAHSMCKAVAASIGIELVWAVITNAYGVGEISSRLINSTMQKCLRGEIPKFTSATQNYDFVYIDDVAKAFFLIGKNGKPFCEYIIGSSSAKPLKEFLLEMNKAIAPDIQFEFGVIPYSGVYQGLDVFDCKKTIEDTGFVARVNFAEGCRRTYEWLKTIKDGERK